MKCVVIGGGLTGLSLVHWLHKFHLDKYDEIVLLEASERLGGDLDGSELGYLPISEVSGSALEWLRSVSPLPLHWHEVDEQPLYFESGEWRPFLGFGDFPAAAVDQLAFLCQPKSWRAEPGLEMVVRSLCEQLPIEARTLAEATGFQCKDGRIQSLIVNAQETIVADEFLFCLNPHLLLRLLPAEALKPTHRARLAKVPAWTSVTMTFRHRQPIETSPALRFVLGSGKEFEPVVGRVEAQRSVWTILVAHERAEDLEHIGDCVRYMRRTIKRVFPELLELAGDEKIKVRPHAIGQVDLKLKNGLTFPELPNLHLADPRMSAVPGDLSGAAIAAQLAATPLFVAQPQKPVLIDSQAEI